VHSLESLDYKITIISSAKCIPFIDNLKDCKLIDYKASDFNVSEYFDKEEFDHILFTTPPEYSEKTFINLYPRSSLLIHNINYWLSPFSNLYFWLKPKNNILINFLKFIKYAPSTLINRKSYLSQFQRILVPSVFLKRENKEVDEYIDLRFPYHKPSSDSLSDKLTIAVPGTINSSRNYSLLLENLADISTKLKKHITVEFLGKGKILNPPSSAFLSINSYPEGVEKSHFDNVMSRADFGILNLKPYKSYKGILEEKGKSNISGAINDFYRFGLPALVPDFYPIDEKYGLFTHYSEDFLCQILEEWIAGSHSQDLRRNFLVQRDKLASTITEHNQSVLS
jgi:hypothetical protein